MTQEWRFYPLIWPAMTLAARFSSTMLQFLELSLKTQPRSSPLLLLTVLLSRPHLRSDCLQWRCPSAHISLTQLSCGPHPLPVLRWLPGRSMGSSLRWLPQPNASRRLAVDFAGDILEYFGMTHNESDLIAKHCPSPEAQDWVRAVIAAAVVVGAVRCFPQKQCIVSCASRTLYTLDW